MVNLTSSKKDKISGFETKFSVLRGNFERSGVDFCRILSYNVEILSLNPYFKLTVKIGSFIYTKFRQKNQNFNFKIKISRFKMQF